MKGSQVAVAGYSDVKGQLEAEAIGESLYAPARPGYVTTGQVADETIVCHWCC